MKKVLALILALVLVLSLVACGGSGEKKEDTSANEETTVSKLDANNAIAETPKHIYDDAMENQAKVKQNTYIVNCTVDAIKETYFECRNLQIYLSSDELAKLNKDDEVAIIGKVTEYKEETDAYGGITTYVVFGEAELYDGTVPEVAPRDNEIFTGILKGERKDKGFEGAWDIEYKGSNYLKLIYFADGEDTSSLEYGDTITFTADILGETDDPDRFYNAKIIKIE